MFQIKITKIRSFFSRDENFRKLDFYRNYISAMIPINNFFPFVLHEVSDTGVFDLFTGRIKETNE